MMLALFLLYERAGGDSRLAGVAALVYAANPGFLFFDCPVRVRVAGVAAGGVRAVVHPAARGRHRATLPGGPGPATTLASAGSSVPVTRWR